MRVVRTFVVCVTLALAGVACGGEADTQEAMVDMGDGTPVPVSSLSEEFAEAEAANAATQACIDEWDDVVAVWNDMSDDERAGWADYAEWAEANDQPVSYDELCGG